MEPIEVSKLDELLDRATNLMNRVEDTYLVAKDILLGTNIADWVADLAASGTGSATYADSDRMNALIENTDACRNVNVAQYLLDWAVAQNKANTYFGSALGDLSGVTWESLTSVNAIMANNTAFTAIANDSILFSAVIGNAVCKKSVFNMCAYTEPVILQSNTALGTLRSQPTSDKQIWDSWGDYSYPLEQDVFIVDGIPSSPGDSDGSWVNLTLGRPNADQETYTFSYPYKVGAAYPINKFASRVEFQSEGTSVRLSIRYVDFS